MKNSQQHAICRVLLILHSVSSVWLLVLPLFLSNYTTGRTEHFWQICRTRGRNLKRDCDKFRNEIRNNLWEVAVVFVVGAPCVLNKHGSTVIWMMQLDALRSLQSCERGSSECHCPLVDNFRPTMPLNGRVVLATFRKFFAWNGAMLFHVQY